MHLNSANLRHLPSCKPLPWVTHSKRFLRIDRTCNKYPQLRVTHSRHSNGETGKVPGSRGERRNNTKRGRGNQGGLHGRGSTCPGHGLLTPATCLPQCSVEFSKCWLNKKVFQELGVVRSQVSEVSLEVLQLLLSLGNQLEEARETQIPADTKGPAALPPCWFPPSPFFVETREVKGALWLAVM